MKRIFTLLILVFSFTLGYAQLSQDDIVFWIGEGDQEAYFLVDFRDDTEDASFGWGIRFNEGDEISMEDVLTLIEEADSGFNSRVTSGFLNDVVYNHHAGIDSEPDWWSTWSGDSADLLGMQGGISEELVDGKWYGLSYGFMPEPVAPTFKYAAYSPEWFDIEEIEYWIGEGENQAAITIDFVEDDNEEEVTYVWGIKFDGVLTGDQALEIIAAEDADLEVNIDENGNIESILYNDMLRELDSDNSWKAFIGNTMSDYRPVDLDVVIEDNQLFGVSYGDDNVRRPYIPTVVEDPSLGIHDITVNKVRLWPNPTVDVLYIDSQEAIKQLRVVNTLGAVVLQDDGQKINVNNLPSGVYVLEITTHTGVENHRFIKK